MTRICTAQKRCTILRTEEWNVSSISSHGIYQRLAFFLSSLKTQEDQESCPGAHGVLSNKYIKVHSRSFKRQHNTGCLDIADCPWPLLLIQGYICISFLQSAHTELPHSGHQTLCWAPEVQVLMWVAVSLPG